jgi:sugar (pentulose or hexulose) kinase
MTEPLRCVSPDSVITGWDFSTGGVKCLAFDLKGQTLAEVRLPTDLWTENDVRELNLMQLQGQARDITRAIASRLRAIGRLGHWVAGGISATHHTSGRIDADRLQVRRAICWNDPTLAAHHAVGLERLGGAAAVERIIGGPWAIRYSLSHLVKDETTLSGDAWRKTWRILSHGSLAAGYLTGNFDTASVSAAASTGIMDLRSCQWRREMLHCIENQDYRDLAWRQLPRILLQHEPVGPLVDHLALECGLERGQAPLVFPTSDDQQAGLIGGGAVDDGQLAIILGNSAVVNSSSERVPQTGSLDVMRLNWGPYLWMRCFSNGAQFIDPIVGDNPDWKALEEAARQAGPGAVSGGQSHQVTPFAQPEPSMGVKQRSVQWFPHRPESAGLRYRAALEALAYLIKGGVLEHEAAGQKISRITVSGGTARSDLMCEILASVLDKPLLRLVSFEGPALGAAVTALVALETHLRRQRGMQGAYSAGDAVGQMVQFRPGTITPKLEWVEIYRKGYDDFRRRLG